jgi:hypothetical protein
MHKAVDRVRLVLVLLLLMHGAGQTIRDTQGSKALEQAEYFGWFEITQLLKSEW